MTDQLDEVLERTGFGGKREDADEVRGHLARVVTDGEEYGDGLREEARRQLAAITPELQAIDSTAVEVVDEPSTDLDVWRRMDLADERQIMDELQGRALDVMLYSFPQDGKTATGFSWKGAREAVRTLNARGYTKIRMKPEIEPKIEEFVDEDNDDAYRVTVYAEDTRNGGGAWGIASAKKKPPRKNNKPAVPDKFAVTKALSKAQRNAFETLIPLELVEYLKAQYLGLGQVQVIPGAGSVEIEKPPPLDDDEARELMDQMRGVYDEIKALDNGRLAMPAGQFNSILISAQHSHDRLRDALAHLIEFRDNERTIQDRLAELRPLMQSDAFDREVSRMHGGRQQQRLARAEQLLDGARSQA